MSAPSTIAARRSGIRCGTITCCTNRITLTPVFRNPNYLWPADRAWCVVTDTDLEWAYVAGTPACIEEILAVPEGFDSLTPSMRKIHSCSCCQ
jgi:hypothetical protein